MQLKLTPTRLESYRLLMEEDWYTEERLIEDIAGQFVETPQILLGRAFHDLLETGSHQNRDYRFLGSEITDHFGDIIDEPSMIHEISGRRSMIVDGIEVIISTRADALLGNKLYEWKTTEKSLQMQKYIDSCQWKFCLWAMRLPVIEYRAVQLKRDKDAENLWHIANYESTGDLYWSDSMLEDMQQLARGLIEFHYKHGLQEKIIVKQKAA